eukprot:6465706-Amphidinium_carterae.4
MAKSVASGASSKASAAKAVGKRKFAMGALTAPPETVVAEPKPKKRQMGLCKCSLCGTHTFTAQFGKQPCEPQQAAKWALYKPSPGEEPTPVDDKCETCFQVWKACYKYMDWETLVSNAAEPEVREQVNAAMKRITMGLKPMEGENIMKVTAVQVEVSRLFHIANEKEVKRLAKQPRLLQSVVKGLPTMSIPSEKGDGTFENCYVFKHPHGDLREARVKVLMQTSSCLEALPKDASYFAEQADETFQHYVESSHDSSGVAELLAKEVYLHDFQTWKAEKFGGDAALDGGAEAAGTAAESDQAGLGFGDDEGEDELTGVAAAEMQLQRANTNKALEKRSFATPPTKAKAMPPKYRSADSSFSVGSDTGDGLSREVEKWKSRIDLSKLLKGDVDGRSISGLEKCIAKLEECTDPNKDKQTLCVLNNFMKLIDKLKLFSKASIINMETKDLNEYLELIKAESVELPISMKRDLLRRHTTRLEKEMKHAELLNMLNPFTESSEPFDPFHPMLVQVDVDASKKLKTYEEQVFEQLLVDWISQGDDKKEQVLRFCQQALAIYVGIDTVELSDKMVAEYSDHRSVLSCCIALRSSSPDLSYQQHKRKAALATYIKLCTLKNESNHETNGECGFQLLPSGSHASYQADVEKCKNAIGKTTRSVLTLVGGAMDTNPWWHQRLWGFLKQLPALNEWSEKLVEYKESLAQATLGATGATLLEEVARDLINIKQSLSNELTDGLDNVVLNQTCKWCKDAADPSLALQPDTNLPVLKSLQKAIAELVLIYPADDGLVEASHCLGNTIMSMQASKGTQNVTNALHEMAEHFKSEPTESNSHISNLHHLCSAILWPQTLELSQTTKTSMASDWQAVLKVISSMVFTYPVQPSMDASVIQQALVVLEKIPEIGAFKSTHTGWVTETLSHCYSAQAKLMALKPSADTSTETALQADGAHEKLRSLQRALMGVDAVQAKVKDMPAPFAELIKEAMGVHTVGKSVAADFIKAWEAEAMASLNAAKKELSAIGGGKKDGKTWSDNVDKKTSLKDMLSQFKKRELFDVDPVQLLEKINACQKVCGCNNASIKAEPETSLNKHGFPFGWVLVTRHILCTTRPGTT